MPCRSAKEPANKQQAVFKFKLVQWAMQASFPWKAGWKKGAGKTRSDN